MENLFSTLGKNELLCRSQLIEYFNYMVNETKTLNEVPYNLEFGDFEDCKSKMHYIKDSNTYVINLKEVLMEDLHILTEPYNHNMQLLSIVHTIIADIELRRAIKNGVLHLYDPEAFICLVHEYIDNYNTKDKLVRDRYCTIRTYQYNIQALEEATKYGLPKEYLYGYIDYTNNRVIDMINKKGYSPLEEAIVSENTPYTYEIYRDGLEYRKYGKNMNEYFDQDILSKYNVANELFYKRGYLRVSGSLHGKFSAFDYPTIKELRESDEPFSQKIRRFFLGNKMPDVEDLENDCIMNKLLFGKRLTPNDIGDIYGMVLDRPRDEHNSIIEFANSMAEEYASNMTR